MRTFFINLYELYRIVVGVAVVVLIVLHFVILAPHRHGSRAVGAQPQDSSRVQPTRAHIEDQ